MKKLVVVTLVLSMSLLACKTEKKEEKAVVKETKVEVASIVDGAYTAKVETSILNWKGASPKGAHNGAVALKEGNLTIKDGNLVAGKFVLDMNSISVLDIPADNKDNAQLTGHLKNKDFFGVVENPTSVFEITSVEGNLVKGNLTIKGISKPITFTSKLTSANGVLEFSSEPFKVDRSEFDIKYKSKKFFENLKDKFIDDEFEVSFKVQASK